MIPRLLIRVARSALDFGVLVYGFIVSPQKKKIPVATKGRSLSGGVTGCIVPNFVARRKGAKFVFYGNRVEKQERKAA